MGELEHRGVRDEQVLALLLVVDREELVDQVVFVVFVDPFRPDLGVVEIQVAQALPEGGIEEVLYGVISAPRHLLGDQCPLLAVDSDQIEQKLKIDVIGILGRRKTWAEVVEPSELGLSLPLPALLAGSLPLGVLLLEFERDLGPFYFSIFGFNGGNKGTDEFVLLR